MVRRGSTVAADEPLSELAASAVVLHELFTAYLTAGFTESQALALVSVTLTTSINNNQGGGAT